jgi:hypothetical protein
MTDSLFISVCKQEVIDYVMQHTGEKITEDDVRVVWLCKALQNNKALLSTNRADGVYYEMTYNGQYGELYVDVYQKVNNYTVVV